LLLKLSLDDEISYFENQADKYFDLLGIKRTVGYMYYTNTGIRNNAGN
jgi:hypothetical protein